MPSVTLRTTGASGKEETLTEYFCDWPDCPNVAEHVIGAIRELRVASAVCKTHAAAIAARRQR
jgi:hypothetical protein